MPAAYSYDLRERVVASVEEGLSRRRAAHRFRVGISTVVRWVARLATTGSCAAMASGGDHKSKVIEAHKDWLLALVKAEPDLTLPEIRVRLQATHGLKKSCSCLWRFFARHDITFKKTSSGRWPAWGGRNGWCYVRPEGSGRKVFGGCDPVKKRGPWVVADLRVVTPSGDPV